MPYSARSVLFLLVAFLYVGLSFGFLPLAFTKSKPTRTILPVRLLFAAGADRGEPQSQQAPEIGPEQEKENGLRKPLAADPVSPQREPPKTVNDILMELVSIQKQEGSGVTYCILGTRFCSYLHQQMIEMLSYALVLSGNHVFTSGAGGTHQAAIRGGLRAEKPELLTVILPQSLEKQPEDGQALLKKVKDLIEMPENDGLPLSEASRICNKALVNRASQLIAFAFHDSSAVLEAVELARSQNKPVTMLFMD